MSPWIRELFLNVLPRLLLMRRPQNKRDKFPKVAVRTCDGVEIRDTYGETTDLTMDNIHGNYMCSSSMRSGSDDILSDPDTMTPMGRRQSRLPPTVMQAMIGVSFIADHMKQQDEFDGVRQDWQFVAMVLDRLFLWIFTAACLVGTFGIIVQAPTLYDMRAPLG